MRKQSLLIRKIQIENIKSLSNVSIDLSDGDKVKHWLLVFGDNGVGKSTLLRCITLALGNADDASTLFRTPESDWIRADSTEKDAKIYLEFDGDKINGKWPSIKITIKKSNNNEIISDYVSHPKSEEFRYDHIFACGYGAGRGVDGDETPNRYRIVDAVYSLFDYETKLSNPETAIRRLEDLSNERNVDYRHKQSTDWIDEILLLEPGSTSLNEKGLVVRTNSLDLQLPFSSLADGYKGVITFVSDFLSRASIYYESLVSRQEIAGIVLIDELDQHLHPLWQRRIIRQLNKMFPNVQFITTTHTPMCAMGATDLEDNDVKLVVLECDEQGCRLLDGLSAPRGQTPDRILTSVLFGLSSVSDDETTNKIKEYSDLLSKDGRSRIDQNRFQKLQKELSKYVSSKNSEIGKLVSESLRETIRERVRENIRQDSNARNTLYKLLTNDLALDAEIIRQSDEIVRSGEEND